MNLSKSNFVQFFFLLVFTTCYSQSDLLVFPKRLEFNGTQNRIKILRLSNIGKDTATYRISYKEKRMIDNGSLEVIDDISVVKKPASPYLRFYPRSITLAPNETQVLKIQLVKTSDLEPGEYRSHLDLRSVPKNTLRTTEEESKHKDGLGVKIQPIYGLAIANIIRIGEMNANISVSDINFEWINETTPVLSLVFNRRGNASTYGDLRVTHISPEGETTEVGYIRGFAVYTPGNIRTAKLALKKLEGIDYQKGRLKILYSPEGTENKKYVETYLEL